MFSILHDLECGFFQRLSARFALPAFRQMGIDPELPNGTDLTVDQPGDNLIGEVAEAGKRLSTLASYITCQASQRALHQLCDPLRVHPQHDSYFPITQSLGAQQYGVTLLRGKAPHGCPHTTKLLPFEGKLFRAQRGSTGSGTGAVSPTLLSAM